MRFALTFDCNNSAFVPEPTDEILAVLNRVRGAVADGLTEGSVFDTNGNRVGRFVLVGIVPEEGE